MISLKPFQQQAVDSAVAVFDYMRGVLDHTGADENARATAIHDNGYLLIEAPTGSGKTLMAGHIVERVSLNEKVVWFWFAPFKGVVDQSAAFLREQFTGLRLRTMTDDRNPIGTRSGDVFVTTWQLVATRVKDRRSVRQNSEQNTSIDDLILDLREQGYRIGVVVDEAHHGFHGETQAAVFFRQVLKPEFTVLVTATPDDADLRDLKERMQISTIHRVGVSRNDAVGPGPEAGLIKSGVKAIAWRAEEGTDVLVDFEQTALRDGAELHKFLKSELKRAGVNLTPLMLVQVDSSKNSVERAKAKLLGLGFIENQIAIHTADEPDAGLLAIANDESREVLIFKMAVALGFDCPRAWTLVSMRSAKDEDFGVQLVGRILRVHRRLQGRIVPEALKFGYVLLADIDLQSGLDTAGQRINRIKTELATVSPTTVFITNGEKLRVQSASDGGTLTFETVPPIGAVFEPPPASALGEDGNVDPVQGTLFATTWAPTEMREHLRAFVATPPVKQKIYFYPIRSNAPRVFKSQEMPDDVDVTEEDVAGKFEVEAGRLLDAVLAREQVRVTKKTLEIFTSQTQMEFSFAPPSLEEMQKKAFAALRSHGMFSAKALREALAGKLQVMLERRGVEDARDWGKLNNYLDILLTQFPELLRNAQKAALAARAQIIEAKPLPDHVQSDAALTTSARNIYGVIPEHLNSWEQRFAACLDEDDSGNVLWWHRNPCRKDWSINVLLESGAGFFPDFVVGIKDRPREQHALLADTKYAYDTNKELPKLLAEHASYGRVLILAMDSARKWRIAKIEDGTGRGVLGKAFQLSETSRLQ